MITVQIPNILIEKVSNGWIVQWSKKQPTQQSTITTAVCASTDELLEKIKEAAAEVESSKQHY